MRKVVTGSRVAQLRNPDPSLSRRDGPPVYRATSVVLPGIGLDACRGWC